MSAQAGEQLIYSLGRKQLSANERQSILGNTIATLSDVASSDADIYSRFLYKWSLVLTVIVTVIKIKDKLYNTTTIDY